MEILDPVRVIIETKCVGGWKTDSGMKAVLSGCV